MTPGSRIRNLGRKKSRGRIRFFGLKILKFFDADADPGSGILSTLVSSDVDARSTFQLWGLSLSSVRRELSLSSLIGTRQDMKSTGPAWYETFS
jgi:hypothetical protein